MNNYGKRGTGVINYFVIELKLRWVIVSYIYSSYFTSQEYFPEFK